MTSAENFLNQNEKNLREFITDESIDKLQIEDPLVLLDYITDYLIGVSIIELDDTTKQRLRNFYAANLPYCFELAFKEVLKNDDKGFKAFQIWTFENLQVQNAQVLSTVEQIQQTIENLRNGSSAISEREIDNILKAYTEKIYQQLAKDFEDIKIILQNLSQEIRDNFQKQYAILTEINERTQTIEATTHRIDTITAKMYQNVKTVLDTVTEFKESKQQIISRHLTKRPFLAQVFLGRTKELENIKEKLFKGNNLLLLVNGHGGVGKTSLASQYYNQYEDQYTHLAWVLSEKSITNALLLLADPLNIQFEESMTQSERLDKLLTSMASLLNPAF